MSTADSFRFFSQSWHNPINVCSQERSICQNQVMQSLDILSLSLPSRYTDTILRLTRDAGQLFTEHYPFTLTHDDLGETNLLVDPSTGHITGVIDWIDAKIRPFGFDLWGLQNILGRMDQDGWHFSQDHKADEELFWSSFENYVRDSSFYAVRRRIELARYIGIVLRYGFRWSEESSLIPVERNDSRLLYLDAFIK